MWPCLVSSCSAFTGHPGVTDDQDESSAACRLVEGGAAADEAASDKLQPLPTQATTAAVAVSRASPAVGLGLPIALLRMACPV